MQGYTVTPACGEVFEHMIWQKVMWLKIWLIETSLEIHPFAIVFFIIMYRFFYILLVQSNRWKWPWHVTASAFDLWMLLNETSIIHHISMNITCLVCFTVNFLLLDLMVINDLDSTPLFHPRFTPSSVWRPGGCNLWRIHENCRSKLGFAKSAKSAVFFRILLSTWRHVAARSLCHHIQLRHGVKAWEQANQGRCRASGTSHTWSSTQFDPSSLQPSCWWVVSKRVHLVSLLDGCDDAGWNPILASNIQANYELYSIPDYSGTDSCFFQ